MSRRHGTTSTHAVGPEAASRRTGIRGLLHATRQDFRSTPGAVTIVMLAAVVLNILSYYFGSRRFFREALATGGSGSDLPEFAWWFSAEFVLLFLVPLALIRLVHRRPLTEFGLGFGDVRLGLRVTALFVLVMLPIVWIVSGTGQFQEFYPHSYSARESWSTFMAYEALFLLYFTGWEFIWRGYMLFGLKDHVGPATANLMQMIPFALMHNGKPFVETFGAVVAGLALGSLALRTRSFWYCVLTHWLVMFSIDIACVLRDRYGITALLF